MSLAAIQDNLVKAPLVQQTQTRGDDVARGQELGTTAAQKEENRRKDEVVLHTQEGENRGIRPDEEKEKEGGKKKRQPEQEEDEAGTENESAPEQGKGDGGGAEPGPREVMRRINIII